ncbi:Delta(9)-fatty-acid desaturase fat-7 [Eumeta japonica]|uniref:Delta(9)-fatty-acid desaturase fat-7 n=1 Tax=Eumeta variegata TaxID=151549 RepID=A0A4C1U8T8_EUMVA|nr:Delta(9)-fatty-acid desaturase fat-7 [Eumeta japonica]
MNLSTITTNSVVGDCINVANAKTHKQFNQEDLCISESEITQEKSAFDEMLPKHDPQFLTPIRRWEKRMGFVTPLRWVNVTSILLYHLVTLVWFLYNAAMGLWPKWQTWLFFSNTHDYRPTTIFLMTVLLILRMTGFGVTAGAHRYWCHRSYKAKTPLRLILLLCYTMAGQNTPYREAPNVSRHAVDIVYQNTIFEWVRDHRVHHKHSETAADPHDVTRGFWFSHGLAHDEETPEVLRAGRAVDMSDILRDPLVAMHTRTLFPNLNHQYIASFLDKNKISVGRKKGGDEGEWNLLLHMSIMRKSDISPAHFNAAAGLTRAWL